MFVINLLPSVQMIMIVDACSEFVWMQLSCMNEWLNTNVYNVVINNFVCARAWSVLACMCVYIYTLCKSVCVRTGRVCERKPVVWICEWILCHDSSQRKAGHLETCFDWSSKLCFPSKVTLIPSSSLLIACYCFLIVPLHPTVIPTKNNSPLYLSLK